MRIGYLLTPVLLATFALQYVYGQTAPQPVPPSIASQQSINRVNADRESAETAIRHYEESVVLHDQNRQNEIAALTKENESLTKENKTLADKEKWWADCMSEKIAGCRQWLESIATPGIEPTAIAK